MITEDEADVLLRCFLILSSWGTNSASAFISHAIGPARSSSRYAGHLGAMRDSNRAALYTTMRRDDADGV